MKHFFFWRVLISAKIALTLTAAMMAQIPVGKKQKRVAITAGTVQSRSGTLTITGAG